MLDKSTVRIASETALIMLNNNATLRIASVLNVVVVDGICPASFFFCVCVCFCVQDEQKNWRRKQRKEVDRKKKNI